MHRQRGEPRDADHWAAQSAEIERLEVTTSRSTRHSRMRLRSWGDRWSRPTRMVSRSLTAAVRRLQADCGDEIGEFLRPDAEPAAQLHAGHA